MKEVLIAALGLMISEVGSAMKNSNGQEIKFNICEEILAVNFLVIAGHHITIFASCLLNIK